MPLPLDFALGDVIRLRKPHPCGSLDWNVVRVGADIGLVCVKCGRRVMLSRAVVERRFKAYVSRGQRAEPFAGAEALQGFDPPTPPGSE